MAKEIVLGYVKGEHGEAGIQGIQGIQGVQGVKGNDGIFDVDATFSQLQTTNKTITGAINENLEKINTVSETNQELVDKSNTYLQQKGSLTSIKGSIKNLHFGIYAVDSWIGITDYPPNAYEFGTLIVLNGVIELDKVWIYFPHNTTTLAYVLKSYGNNYLGWNEMATTETTETGTWTPVLAGSTVSGSNTYSRQVGFYEKSGKIIIANFMIELSGKDPNMAGALAIYGLPYVIKSSVGGSISRIDGFSIPNAYTQFSLFCLGTRAQIQVLGSGKNSDFLTPLSISDAIFIEGSIAYSTL